MRKKPDTQPFKEKLVEIRARLRGDVNAMADATLKRTRSEASGDLSSMPIHMADIGSDNFEQEFTLSLMENDEGTLELIEALLKGLKKGRMVRALNVAAESQRHVSMQSPTHPTASNAQPNSSDANVAGGISVGVSLTAFCTIAVGGCALDLATKSWIFGRLGSARVQQGEPAPPIWLIDNIFGFETSLNEGALFGMGQGFVVAFAVLSVVAALGIIGWLFLARAWQDLHLVLALSFVMAGILGNLYDRLGLHGLTWVAGLQNHSAGQRVYAVRDWLHFKIDRFGFDWPIFNLADSFLVCGAILLLWHAIRRRD